MQIKAFISTLLAAAICLYKPSNMHSSNIGINLLRKHRKNNINRKQQKLTKKNHNMLSFDELRNQRKKFSRLSHIKLEHFYKTIRKSIAKKTNKL